MKRNNNSEGRLSIISKTSKTSRKKSILAAEDSIVLKRKSPDELSIKSSNRDAKSDACSVDKNPRVISKLYLARDSIVLKISSNERKSLMVNIVERNNSEEKSVIIDADQEDNSEDENEVVVRKSKLVLASDSLEIIKSSGKLPTLPKPLKKHEQIKRKIKPKCIIKMGNFLIF